MDRAFKVAESIAKVIGRDFVVAPRPDHPLLLSGPDILIGGRGRTTAVFFLNETTRRSILTARLIAARLAFPIQTRIAGVFLSDLGTMNEFVHREFDEVFDVNSSARQMARYASDERTGTRLSRAAKAAFLDIKQRHLDAFSARLCIADDLRRTRPAEVPDTVSLAFVQRKFRQQLNAPRTGKAPSLDVEGIAVKALPLMERHMEVLRSRWLSTLTNNFHLDTGVPYFAEGRQSEILVTGGWPVSKGDPEKPTRALAFSGEILMQAVSMGEIEGAARRVANLGLDKA